MSAPTSDPIREAIRIGEKERALQLIALNGVWTPFRNPGYFDTAKCFPVFSSPELIPAFLRSVGFFGPSVEAQQMNSDFISFASHLESSLTLNPGTDSEWTFTQDEFAAIVAYARKG